MRGPYLRKRAYIMTTASVFTGIKLSNESRSQLLDLVRAHHGHLLPNIKGKHLTIKFRGSVDKIPMDVMGEWVELRGTSLYETTGVQVIEVQPLGLAEQLSYASIPHVTVALAEGVKGAHAKKVLREEEGLILPEPIILRGQVGFIHDRHGWVFSHLSEEEMVATPRT